MSGVRDLSAGRYQSFLIGLAILAGLALVFLFSVLPLALACSIFAGICYLVLTVWRPVWGLALICSLLTVEGIYAGQLEMTEIRLIGIGAFGAWIAHLVIYGKKLRINSTFVAALVLFLWAGISFLWAPDPEGAAPYYGTLAQLVLLFLLTINVIEHERDFRIVMASLLFGAVATSQLSINLFVTNIIERARTFEAQDPNGYAMTVGLAIIASLYLTSMLKNIWLKLGSALFACLLVFPLILAQSRSGWLAVGTGLIVFLWYTKNRLRNILIVGAVLTGVISASFAMGLVNITLIQRASMLLALRERGSDRFDIWLVAGKIFADNPVLGVGYYQFPKVYNRYRADTPGIRKDQVPNRDPHNLYFKVVTELGIVGLVLLGLILWNIWREETLPRSKIPWITTVLLAYVMAGGIGVSIFNSKLFWLCLALASKAQTLVRERLAVEEGR